VAMARRGSARSRLMYRNCPVGQIRWKRTGRHFLSREHELERPITRASKRSAGPLHRLGHWPTEQPGDRIRLNEDKIRMSVKAGQAQPCSAKLSDVPTAGCPARGRPLCRGGRSVELLRLYVGFRRSQPGLVIRAATLTQTVSAQSRRR
jgi:hypothetical protein